MNCIVLASRAIRMLERIKALPGWAHPYDLMPGHPMPA
jgi:glutathione S-transferase